MCFKVPLEFCLQAGKLFKPKLRYVVISWIAHLHICTLQQAPGSLRQQLLQAGWLTSQGFNFRPCWKPPLLCLPANIQLGARVRGNKLQWLVEIISLKDPVWVSKWRLEGPALRLLQNHWATPQHWKVDNRCVLKQTEKYKRKEVNMTNPSETQVQSKLMNIKDHWAAFVHI